MEHTLPLALCDGRAATAHVQETFDYHYGKHHQAYVTNLNNLIKGTELTNASLEAIIKKSFRRRLQQRCTGVNDTFFWNWMKPNGGGAPSGALADAINKKLEAACDDFKKAFERSAVATGSWTWAGGRKADGALDIVNTWVPLACSRRTGDKALLRVDASEVRLYIDQPQPAPQVC